jgi:hypothetical protein
MKKTADLLISVFFFFDQRKKNVPADFLGKMTQINHRIFST